MQQTRLNQLFSRFYEQGRVFFANPWRKLSFIIIGWLLGFSLPTVLTSSISQGGDWDVSVALVFLVTTEIMDRIVYNPKNRGSQKPWWRDLLYSFKLGFVYGLYLDGVILTS